jgi:hypothetical protein
MDSQRIGAGDHSEPGRLALGQLVAAIIGWALLGTFVGGVAGVVVMFPIAELFAGGVERAIWVALGGLVGLVSGFFGGVLLALHRHGIGGDA